jgi:SAM-dependent methyltransferase
LRVCAGIAEQIGLANLTLKQESLNATDYAEAFDYVLCTGVIHHNADPALPLASLSRALKPGGVLELMVYNYYHRIQTTAFQKAIRLLGGGDKQPDLDRELPLTRRLIDSFPAGSHMADMLADQRDMPEAAVADVLLQPVEHSYTIASLAELAGNCGLRLASYCVNQFDKVSGQIEWEMSFEDAEVARAYAALPDLDRWQVTNLLRGETSPRPWFYLQRSNAPQPCPPARELTGAFLDTVFESNATTVQGYMLGDAGRYNLSPARHPCPAPARPNYRPAAAVLAEVDGRKPMRAILDRLGLTAQAERLRLHLATSGYPYLRPVRRPG